jgi:hypothetical protein
MIRRLKTPLVCLLETKREHHKARILDEARKLSTSATARIENRRTREAACIARGLCDLGRKLGQVGNSGITWLTIRIRVLHEAPRPLFVKLVQGLVMSKGYGPEVGVLHDSSASGF